MEIQQYFQHLSTCNTQQNWDDALQAMADTPEAFRDESWHQAHQEIEQKRKTCTCGMEKCLEKTKQMGQEVIALRGNSSFYD